MHILFSWYTHYNYFVCALYIFDALILDTFFRNFKEISFVNIITYVLHTFIWWKLSSNGHAMWCFVQIIITCCVHYTMWWAHSFITYIILICLKIIIIFALIIIYMVNRIGGVMVSSSVVDRGFEHRSGQTRDNKLVFVASTLSMQH